MNTKLLIISNNLLSYNNANGKFLKNYLYKFKDTEICNFYISNDKKAKDESFETLNVTDQDALHYLLRKRVNNSQNNESVEIENYSNNQTPLKHIFRYLIWNFGTWKKSGYKKWIKEQNPTHIVTVMGNNPYLMKLAYKTSKALKLPLIIFIGENYPLKNYDYIQRKLSQSINYQCFKHLLIKHSKKMIKRSKLCFFNTPELKDAYLKKYRIQKSFVCLPPSNQSRINKSTEENGDILYAGNLGLGRFEALLEFAIILKNSNYKNIIKIYSKLSNEQINELKNFNNMEFKGYVNNDELNKAIASSTLLLHVEGDSVYNKIDLQYAFSTKLADLICSNKRILMFAPKGLSESNYFSKNLPNNIATTKDELPNVLKYVLGAQYDFSKQNKLKKEHDLELTSSFIKDEINKL